MAFQASPAGRGLKPRMADHLTHDLIIHLVVFQAVVLLVILSNLRMIHRSRRHVPPSVFPKVSILVPVRNEKRSIADCVQSLLAQDYPSFEVVVLDDQSEDGTASILERIAESQPKLRVLVGAPPPGDQLGKNWACSQLARQAQGDLFFFTDADTLHHPGTLRAIVTALMGEHADLLTGFPRQEVHTWGERLLVPFFSWALLSFNPLILAYRLRLPVLASAVGQVMLFRREAYLAVGGHARMGSSIVDDLMLARQIKAAGMRWRVVYVADLISCRMYRENRQAIDGFAKNLFAAFDFRLLPFLFAFLWLAVMFWEPIIVLSLMIFGQAPQARAIELVACIGLSMLLWLLPYADMRIPLGLAFLYPLTILSIEVVALLSIQRSLCGRLSWKGRSIPRPRWRWL
jgi:chlorobactene glucosyltransferase